MRECQCASNPSAPPLKIFRTLDSISEGGGGRGHCPPPNAPPPHFVGSSQLSFPFCWCGSFGCCLLFINIKLCFDGINRLGKRDTFGAGGGQEKGRGRDIITQPLAPPPPFERVTPNNWGKGMGQGLFLSIILIPSPAPLSRREIICLLFYFRLWSETKTARRRRPTKI